MNSPAILFVTGVCGAGKTTLVRALEERALPGVRCFHFDTLGSPSLSAMMAEHGSPQAWQVTAMHQWMASLSANPWNCRVAVLEGEIPPILVHQTFEERRIGRGRIVLIECDDETRESRLARDSRPLGQGQAQMAAWAQSFRDQAEALGIPVLDTSSAPVADTVKLLARELARLEQAP